MYQELLDLYSDNDTAVYNAIMRTMGKGGVTEITLTKDEEYNIHGDNETVKELRIIPADLQAVPYLEVVTENDTDGERYEYSLTDDQLTQLDKLQLLSIVEDRFGTVS